uniref:prolyl oligopeptidase family serine peptidase n=1 Tax=Stenotrophomonas maltophilia TaxID=40324 RepID=UPI0013DB4D4D
FTDFIAAAEYLVAERFTAKGAIVAHGGSAGGMLMGAIANLRPDLWGGVVAEVPFVDVVNTMLDDSLPLTPPEWREW